MRVKAGGSSIDIDGIQEFVNRVVDQIAPTVRPALQETVETLKADASAKWPVGRERGRKHSKDLFETDVRVGRDVITARLSNSADYARYIKTKQNGLQGRSAYSKLLRTPARKKGKELGAALAEDIRKLAGS